jgi:hypothetical protein
MVHRSGIDALGITIGWYAGTDVDRSIVTVGWYASLAMIGAPSPLDGTLGQRRWKHHHRRMVRQTSVDGYIITARRYAEPGSFLASTPLDDMLGRHRWTHHHRQMVCRTGVKGHIITARWYAEPVMVRYRHCRMVRRSDSGKIPSPWLSTGGDNGRRSPPTYTNGAQNQW